MMKALPDVYVDTSGYAFTFPLFKIFGKCKVGCYVHYPTISTDMLCQVRSRTATYNNKSRISNSWLLSYLKYLYYKVRFKVVTLFLDMRIKISITILELSIIDSIFIFRFLPSYIVKPESIQI